MTNILVLHGPNLNFTGKREPEIYGSTTLEEIDTDLTDRAQRLGITLRIVQSNYEGALIDQLQQSHQWAAGALLNPGALTHYSYALRDAVASVSYPIVEVHMSNPSTRETFRRRSVIAPACRGIVSGFGWRSYSIALEGLARMLDESV